MMAKYFVPVLWLMPACLAVTDGLFSSYVSLSIELIGFPEWAGTKDARNEFSNNLIDNLVEAQKAPLVVRVGGNSADRAIYDKTLQTPTNRGCPNADPGAWQCIGTSFFESYGAFPEGTLYTHDFNLATWNSSGFATLRDTVPLACNALRGQLENFEIGNEPDLFIGSRRPQDYNAQDYAEDWLNETARFEEYLRAACPDMAANGVKYMFPSVSSPGARLHGPDIFKAIGPDAAKKISQVSVHNYMGGATQPGVTLQSTLMNHTAVIRSINGHVNYAKTVSDLSPNADYIIGEHNSLYGGGAAGLSDVFGAALWAMEFSLNAASTGVIKRIHFHQSIGSPYAAWSPSNPMQTKPPYYGKLAASTFLGDSSKIQVKPIAVCGNQDLNAGYAAYEGGELRSIAVLNLKEYDAGSASTRSQKKQKLRVQAGSSWTLMRLTAPGARSQSDITFNGFAYEAASLGKPVRVADRPSGEVVKADGKGNLFLTVADSEAVVLMKK